MDSQESPDHGPIENEAIVIEPLLEKCNDETAVEQPSVVNETFVEESPIEDLTALEVLQKADEAIVEESNCQDEVAVPDIISEDTTPSYLEDDKEPLTSNLS